MTDEWMSVHSQAFLFPVSNQHVYGVINVCDCQVTVVQLKEKLFGSLSSCLDCEVSVMSERRSSSDSQTRLAAGLAFV